MKKSFKYLIHSVVTLTVLMFVLFLATPNQALAKEVVIHTSDYGYGKYTVSVRGIGYDGVYDEDSVVFYYLPVEASYQVDPVTGAYDIKVDSAGEDVQSVDVYLENEYLGTLTRDMFETGYISASLAGKPSGDYNVMIVAKDAEGQMIYKPFILTIHYEEVVVPDAGAPDTGRLFQNLNISQEDYLVTGLIMFFILGIVALGIVTKKGSSKKRR